MLKAHLILILLNFKLEKYTLFVSISVLKETYHIKSGVSSAIDLNTLYISKVFRTCTHFGSNDKYIYILNVDFD